MQCSKGIYRCNGCYNGIAEGTICEVCGECDVRHGSGGASVG